MLRSREPSLQSLRLAESPQGDVDPDRILHLVSAEQCLLKKAFNCLEVFFDQSTADESDIGLKNGPAVPDLGSERERLLRVRWHCTAIAEPPRDIAGRAIFFSAT